jgi:ABC-type spermidine/putrescine transport systems, ATPase components
MPARSGLSVSDLSVRYGPTVALDGADLTVARGEIVAVLGPSGSGKTSLLRAVAGLEPVAGGTVRWDDEDLTHVPAHRRGFGLMFQDHALFSHHDVLRNVTFGLRMQDRVWNRSEAAARGATMLELVGLAGYEHRPVDELSGGEQQRVALARALAPSPRLLMLDEPLASVDRERREQLATELHHIIRATETPTLLVTHDLDEAFTLADTVVMLDHGRVIRAGAAREVWHSPGSIAAARFLGIATELNLPTHEGQVDTPWGKLAAPTGTAARAWLGFRPADLRVTTDAQLNGTVRAVWFRRDHFLLELDTTLGRITAVSPRSIGIGDTVTIAADLDAAVVLRA